MIVGSVHDRVHSRLDEIAEPGFETDIRDDERHLAIIRRWIFRRRQARKPSLGKTGGACPRVTRSLGESATV
jgi:hypothetical protein